MALAAACLPQCTDCRCHDPDNCTQTHEQVAAGLTANGRIAAAIYQSTNNFGSCQIFCTLDSGWTGRCSINWPFPWTNLGLHLIHGSQVPPESILRTASWSYLKELTDHFCQRYSEQIRLAPHPFFLPKNFNETLFFVCEQHSSCKQNVELCFC